MLTRESAAVVQAAVDLEQAQAEIRGLLAKVGEAEAFVGVAKEAIRDWALLIGAKLREVRVGIPERGPRAKKWGDFVASLGITLDSASNYMKAAEVAQRYPVEAAKMSLKEMYRLKRGAEPPNFPNSSGNGGRPTALAQRGEMPQLPGLEAGGESRPMFSSATAAQEPAPATPPLRPERPFVPTLFPEDSQQGDEPCPDAPALDSTPATAPTCASTPSSSAGDPCLPTTTPATSSLASAPATTTKKTSPTGTTTAENAGLLGIYTTAGRFLCAACTRPSDPAEVKVVVGDVQFHGATCGRCGEDVDPDDEPGSADEPRPRTFPAAKPEEPYEIGERIALLRHSPALRGVPEEERPAVAGALVDLAHEIDPKGFAETDRLRHAVNEDRVREYERAEAAEARARELEVSRDTAEKEAAAGVYECLRALGLPRGTLWRADLARVAIEIERLRSQLEQELHNLRNELTKVSLRAQMVERQGADAEREQVAARRGYEQGEREAFNRIAALMELDIDIDATPAEARKAVEEAAEARGQLALDLDALRRELEALRAGEGRRKLNVAVELQQELDAAREEMTTLRRELEMERQPRACGRCETAEQMVREREQEIAALRRQVDRLLSKQDAGAPVAEEAQSELRIEYDEGQRARPTQAEPKKPAAKNTGAKKRPASPPARKWALGDEVIVERRNKVKRGILCDLRDGDQISLVIRTPQGAGPTMSALVSELRPDPEATGRKQAIEEALAYLRGCERPPMNWIAALEVAAK